jgi:hypothetical protein
MHRGMKTLDSKSRDDLNLRIKPLILLYLDWNVEGTAPSKQLKLRVFST